MPGCTCMRRVPFVRSWGYVALLLAFGCGSPLNALTINLTFDSSVINLPNAAQVESACNYAATQFESIFANNITINITVKAVQGTGTFGLSGFGLVGSSYSEIRSNLIANNP